MSITLKPGDDVYAKDVRAGMVIAEYYPPEKRREFARRDVKITTMEVITDYRDTGKIKNSCLVNATGGEFAVKYPSGGICDVSALSTARYTLVSLPE